MKCRTFGAHFCFHHPSRAYARAYYLPALRAWVCREKGFKPGRQAGIIGYRDTCIHTRLSLPVFKSGEKWVQARRASKPRYACAASFSNLMSNAFRPEGPEGNRPGREAGIFELPTKRAPKVRHSVENISWIIFNSMALE